MVTSQQLSEARTHERRRLVTAFVTGALPERTVALPATGRALSVGLALAVLLSVGDVALGLLGSTSGLVSGAPGAG
jgi:hypothetical protein